MTDNLRDRIAKVLCDLYEQRCCEECDVNRIEFRCRDYLDDADAVIAALGLQQEWTSRQKGLVIPDGVYRQRPEIGDLDTRYVTEWTADE